MKKAWKGFAAKSGATVEWPSAEFDTPVLVIDASKFPEDAPEIGSEWLSIGERVTVATHPYLEKDGVWSVGVWPDGNGAIKDNSIASLKPIPPKTAKGEVVGTVRVETDEAGNVTLRLVDAAVMANGTFDIIKRGDK